MNFQENTSFMLQRGPHGEGRQAGTLTRAILVLAFESSHPPFPLQASHAEHGVSGDDRRGMPQKAFQTGGSCFMRHSAVHKSIMSLGERFHLERQLLYCWLSQRKMLQTRPRRMEWVLK